MKMHKVTLLFRLIIVQELLWYTILKTTEDKAYSQRWELSTTCLTHFLHSPMHIPVRVLLGFGWNLGTYLSLDSLYTLFCAFFIFALSLASF